jgi:hypothetical protein
MNACVPVLCQALQRHWPILHHNLEEGKHLFHPAPMTDERTDVHRSLVICTNSMTVVSPSRYDQRTRKHKFE